MLSLGLGAFRVPPRRRGPVPGQPPLRLLANADAAVEQTTTAAVTAIASRSGESLRLQSGRIPSPAVTRVFSTTSGVSGSSDTSSSSTVPPIASVGAQPGQAAAADLEADLVAAATDGRHAVLDSLLHRGVRACGGVFPGVADPPIVAAAHGGHVDALKVLVSHARRGRRAAEAAAAAAAAAAAGGGGRGGGGGGRGGAAGVAVADPPGVGVTARGVGGRTPLHAAAAGGHVAAVKLLLVAVAEVDGNVDATDAAGRTALQEAVYVGAAAVVAELLAKGACRWVCARGCAGKPLLYGAITMGSMCAGTRAAVVRELLAGHAADANTPLNDCAQTPLHVAVIANQPAVVQVLLDAGGRRSAVDIQGRTPLDLCAGRKHNQFPIHLVKLLVTARGDGLADDQRSGYRGSGPPMDLTALMRDVKVALCNVPDRLRCLVLLRHLADLQNKKPSADAMPSSARASAISFPCYGAPQSAEAAEVVPDSMRWPNAEPPSAPTSLDDLDDLSHVYAWMVANPNRLELSALNEVLARPRRTNGLKELRAGHNLLVLAAKNGCLSAVRESDRRALQEKWMRSIYLPSHSGLLPIEVTPAVAILTNAQQRGFLTQCQVSMLTCHFDTSTENNATFRDLYCKVSGLDVDAKVLAAAAAITHRELLELDVTLNRCAALEKRRALQLAVPKIGLTLLPLVGSALGTVLETAVGAGVVVAESGISKLRQAGMAFSVDHSDIGAALAVLSSDHAVRESELLEVVNDKWGSFDCFLETLSRTQALQAEHLPTDGAGFAPVNDANNADGGRVHPMVSFVQPGNGDEELAQFSPCSDHVLSAHGIETTITGTSCVLCTCKDADGESDSPWPKPLPSEDLFKDVCGVCVANLLTGWRAAKSHATGQSRTDFAGAVRAAAARPDSKVTGDALLREGSPRALAKELLKPPPGASGFVRLSEEQFLTDAIEALQLTYRRGGGVSGGSVVGFSGNASGGRGGT